MSMTLDIIKGWADQFDVPMGDIDDVGLLIYRMRDQVLYSEAEELENWFVETKQRKDNEFIEPEPFIPYPSPSIYGKNGRIYWTGGPVEGVPVESEIRFEGEVYWDEY